MESIALILMYVLYVLLSYVFVRRLIDVKGNLLAVMGVICYVGLTWLYTDVFFYFFRWVKGHGVSLDFGHAEQSLIFAMFLEFLTGTLFIIYMIIVRIRTNRRSQNEHGKLSNKDNL